MAAPNVPLATMSRPADPQTLATVSPPNSGTCLVELLERDAPAQYTPAIKIDSATSDIYRFTATPAQGYKFVRWDITQIIRFIYKTIWNEDYVDETYENGASELSNVFTTTNAAPDGHNIYHAWRRAYGGYTAYERCVVSYLATAVFEPDYVPTPTYRLCYNPASGSGQLIYDPYTNQLVYDSIGT